MPILVTRSVRRETQVYVVSDTERTHGNTLLVLHLTIIFFQHTWCESGRI